MGQEIDLHNGPEDWIKNIDVIDLNHGGNYVIIDAQFVLDACDSFDGPGTFAIMINGGPGDQVFGGPNKRHENWLVEMIDGSRVVESYKGHNYHHYFSNAAGTTEDVFMEIGIHNSLMVV